MNTLVPAPEGYQGVRYLYRKVWVAAYRRTDTPGWTVAGEIGHRFDLDAELDAHATAAIIRDLEARCARTQ